MSLEFHSVKVLSTTAGYSLVAMVTDLDHHLKGNMAYSVFQVASSGSISFITSISEMLSVCHAPLEL